MVSMNSLPPTPKFNLNENRNDHWKKFILKHCQASLINKWSMIYGNLNAVRRGSVNKYLFIEMLILLEEELKNEC